MSKYTLRSDTVFDEQGVSHTVYGIELPSENIAVKDIFCKQKEAESFIKLCNDLDLSPLHFHDVIDDILNDDDL